MRKSFERVESNDVAERVMRLKDNQSMVKELDQKLTKGIHIINLNVLLI